MATAADFPSAFAKAERAAGRPLPAGGRVFLSVRDADKKRCRAPGPPAGELGLRAAARPQGLRTRSRRLVSRSAACARYGKPARATVVDLIRRRRCDLVVNTPAGGGARSDGYLIREAALAARVPCITTLAGAFAAVEAIALARREEALSLQEKHAASSA